MANRQNDELTGVLGSRPPVALDDLSAKERKLLAGYIQDALDRHEKIIDEAEENVLRFLPRPVRGPVRKLLMGGK